MRESFVAVQLKQTEAKIERIKRQSIASDQELITLRLQMNAFIRMFKWLFPFNLIFKKLVTNEFNMYKKHLDDRKKEIDKVRQEMAKPQPIVIDPKLQIGRNHVCHCGSGKKFKKCCLGKKDDIKIPTDPKEIAMLAEKAKEVKVEMGDGVKFNTVVKNGKVVEIDGKEINKK